MPLPIFQPCPGCDDPVTCRDAIDGCQRCCGLLPCVSPECARNREYLRARAEMQSSETVSADDMRILRELESAQEAPLELMQEAQEAWNIVDNLIDVSPAPETLPDETAMPANPSRPRQFRCVCCRRRDTAANRPRLPGNFRLADGTIRTNARVCAECRLPTSTETGTLASAYLDCGSCGNHFNRFQARDIDGSILCPACAHGARQCARCLTYTRSYTVGAGSGVFCASCWPHNQSCADCSRIYPRTPNIGSDHPRNRLCDRCYRRRYDDCQVCGASFGMGDSYFPHHCANCTPDLTDFDWQLDDQYIETDCGIDEIAGETFIRTLNSPRRFGVELEFSHSGKTAARYIHRKTLWGACPDGTCGVVQEFKSPPMSGDDGIKSVEEFCGLASQIGLQVSRACGYHLHLDMGGEGELEIARVAAAYQIFLPLWKCFVPHHRRTNAFCCGDRANGTPKDILDMKVKPHNGWGGNRYCAVNWQAYGRHGTVEIRLHTGTTNPVKVNNWIRSHIAFIEWSRSLNVTDVLNFTGATGIDLFAHLRANVWPDDVSAFYQQRARKFGVDLSPAIVPTIQRVESPSDDNWQWTEEDMQRSRERFGRDDVRYLERAYREGYLRRQPPEFTDELGVPMISGYVDNPREIDP